MGFTGADAILTNLCDLMQLLTKRYTRNKTIQHQEDLKILKQLLP